MAQDTRKDPRAKVLTMTVRYKSATVDEFIEHHSHDVSRGGIFIKTPSPFLPGTLLKFEIRIADDKPMLQGVGRVVWKREPAGAGPDKPAGMGVKFIKVDEASRNLIDRLVTSKGGGQSAYDSESPADAPAAAAAPPPAPQPRAAPAPNPAPVGAAPARPAGVAPVGPAIRKATMIGLGINAAAAASSPPAGRARSQAPRPVAEPMFPKTNSEQDMPPPEERTVMKQAAQLLEEALKGAGGSIDEVGSGALTSEPPRAQPHVAADDDEPTVARAAPAPSSRRPDPTAIPLERRAVSTAPRDGVSPASVRPSSRPSSRPSARAVPALPPIEPIAKKKSSGGRVALSLLLVAGAAAAAYFVWQKKEPKAEVAAPVPAVTAPQPAPIAPVEPPPTVDTAAVAPSAAAPLVSASASASAAPSVAPAVVAPASAPKPAMPAPAPAPKPAAAAPAEKPVPAEKPAAAEKPAPAEKPAAEEKPAPAPKPVPVVAAPKPKPAPKPAEEGAAPAPKPKPSDDNPY